jgi:hypothetical protein
MFYNRHVQDRPGTSNKGHAFLKSLELALSPQLANESKTSTGHAQREERLRERKREAAILGGVDEAMKRAKQYGRLYYFSSEAMTLTISRCP